MQTHVKTTLLYITEVREKEWDAVVERSKAMVTRCQEAGVKHIPIFTEEQLAKYKSKVS